MDAQLTWTDCDEAGDYVVPNVLSPRDLVPRPDNMDKTVLHTVIYLKVCYKKNDLFQFFINIKMCSCLHHIIDVFFYLFSCRIYFLGSGEGC